MSWLEEVREQGRRYREMAGGRHHTGIGPGGLNICPTPGMRIRSGGRGRGLARGRGRGPLGIPFYDKEV